MRLGAFLQYNKYTASRHQRLGRSTHTHTQLSRPKQKCKRHQADALKDRGRRHQLPVQNRTG